MKISYDTNTTLLTVVVGDKMYDINDINIDTFGRDTLEQLKKGLSKWVYLAEKISLNNLNRLSGPRECFSSARIVNEHSITAKLYKIIDDIDTALDVFKPDLEPFENFVIKKIFEKNHLITSDGYKLYYV